MILNPLKRIRNSARPAIATKNPCSSDNSRTTSKRVSFASDDDIREQIVEIEIPTTPKEKKKLWYSKEELDSLFKRELALNRFHLPVSRTKWENDEILCWRGMEHLATEQDRQERNKFIRETVKDVITNYKRHHKLGSQDTDKQLQSFSWTRSQKSSIEAQKRASMDARAVHGSRRSSLKTFLLGQKVSSRVHHHHGGTGMTPRAGGSSRSFKTTLPVWDV